MRWSLASAVLPLIISAMVIFRAPVHAADEAPPYLKHFPEKQHESARLVAQKHRRLMQTWLNMYSAKVELNQQKLIFGGKKRAAASRQIAKLEAYLDKHGKTYERDFKNARDIYKQEIDDLKGDHLKLENRIAKRPDSSASKNLREKADALSKDIEAGETILAVFTSMEKKLDTVGEDMNRAKLYRVDEKTFATYATQYPDVVEAANVVKDYHADIAEVKQLMAENPKLERALANLESELTRARENLERTVELEKKALERPYESLKKAEEKISERIAAIEHRGKTADEEVKAKAQIIKKINAIESVNAFFDGMIAGTEPAKENDNKKPTKKKKPVKKVEETSPQETSD
ncbi:MAG: hypothetical protein RRC34_00360 [Lentisphaeria bacterium]|nr:hypothetical protein [Lentisphaeria bacterium]